MPGWVIVAFGANAANPHHIPGETRLQTGDTILVDMGSPPEGLSFGYDPYLLLENRERKAAPGL